MFTPAGGPEGAATAEGTSYWGNGGGCCGGWSSNWSTCCGSVSWNVGCGGCGAVGWGGGGWGGGGWGGGWTRARFQLSLRSRGIWLRPGAGVAAVLRSPLLSPALCLSCTDVDVWPSALL